MENDPEASVLQEKLASMPERSCDWPLHLKAPTLLDFSALFALPVAHSRSTTRLEEVMPFFEPEFYRGLRTSRTIKTTSLSMADVRLAVEKGKFELAMPEEEQRRLFQSSRHTGSQSFGRLPDGWHGVNVFYVLEMKGRRRLITEPLLNGVVSKDSLPKVSHPGRLQKRQMLRKCKYLFQLDFDAFYDAIPLDHLAVRNNFVFRGKDGLYYRLKTLPTGARWSVCAAQAVTSAIVDIDTPVIVLTLIDNIMIAAQEGQESEFVRAVRSILTRIGAVNLQTSPDRRETLELADADLLALATQPNVFLGEEYSWDASLGERVMRNSHKTVAKLQLAIAAFPEYTCRSFAGLVSLILFAAHTVSMNPARLFLLLKAYRAVYIAVAAGRDWDAPIPHVSPSVSSVLFMVADELLQNTRARIPQRVVSTYHEQDYDYVIFTDASAEGWGAIVTQISTGEMTLIQKRWDDELVVSEGTSSRGDASAQQSRWRQRLFQQRHSAQAEPRAALECLLYLNDTGRIHDGARIALVTDHAAIVLAQRKSNGYGGIGRGGMLNLLYEWVYNALFERHVSVTFFYIAGPQNPADTLSRQFTGDGLLREQHSVSVDVPFLRDTFCQLCEDE